MQMPHNIERAAFPSTNKAYVGYGRGLVWRIRKSGTGGWEAFAEPGYERAATLAELSNKIEAPDRADVLADYREECKADVERTGRRDW
jgi:hypothetical protein